MSETSDMVRCRIGPHGLAAQFVAGDVLRMGDRVAVSTSDGKLRRATAGDAPNAFTFVPAEDEPQEWWRHIALRIIAAQFRDRHGEP